MFITCSKMNNFFLSSYRRNSIFLTEVNNKIMCCFQLLHTFKESSVGKLVGDLALFPPPSMELKGSNDSLQELCVLHHCHVDDKGMQGRS